MRGRATSCVGLFGGADCVSLWCVDGWSGALSVYYSDAEDGEARKSEGEIVESRLFRSSWSRFVPRLLRAVRSWLWNCGSGAP